MAIISGSAFEMIETLEEISFQEKSNVKYIDTKAFAYSSLKRLMIPKSVERIAGSASLWTKLSSVPVESGSDRFLAGHGVTQNIIDARLAMYFGRFSQSCHSCFD
jgi:hypothetical protein